MIGFIYPRGMEKYFEELVKLISSGAQPGGKEHLELNDRYGQTTDGLEWIPQLTVKFQRRLIGP